MFFFRYDSKKNTLNWLDQLLRALLPVSICFSVLINILCLNVGLTSIFPHIYYIPIIIAAYLYPEYGLLFSEILGSFYILSVIIMVPFSPFEIFSALIRFMAFLGVAIVVSLISTSNREMTESLVITQFAVDSSPEEVFFIKPDGGLMYANKQACKIFGFSQEEVDKKNIFEINPDCNQERWVRYWAELKCKKNDLTETVHKRPDGSIYPVEVSKSYLAFRDKEFSCNFCRDITEKKIADKALIDSEERLKLALEGAHLSVWDWYIGLGDIIYDSGFADMLGYSHDEIENKIDFFYTHLHPGSVPLAKKYVNKIYENPEYGKKLLDEEIRLRCKNGSYKWMRIAGEVAEWDDDGKPSRMIGIFMDISNIKAYQEALSRTNKKLNLLSGITRHDIQNMLTVAIGYASFLKEAECDQSSPVKETYLEKIIVALENIRRQIAFTRDYQDLGVGKPKWQDTTLMIEKTIGESENFWDLNIINNVAGIQVYADPLFRKVLYNLIENSLRHGEHVTTIRLSFIEDDVSGTLIYEDNGIGISDDKKEKIFERGYGSNTGFGLFLSKEILDITGFTIKECGNEGEGARFEITIPKEMYRLQ